MLFSLSKKHTCLLAFFLFSFSLLVAYSETQADSVSSKSADRESKGVSESGNKRSHNSLNKPLPERLFHDSLQSKLSGELTGRRTSYKLTKASEIKSKQSDSFPKLQSTSFQESSVIKDGAFGMESFRKEERKNAKKLIREGKRKVKSERKHLKKIKRRMFFASMLSRVHQPKAGRFAWGMFISGLLMIAGGVLAVFVAQWAGIIALAVGGGFAGALAASAETGAESFGWLLIVGLFAFGILSLISPFFASLILFLAGADTAEPQGAWTLVIYGAGLLVIGIFALAL